MDGKSFDAAKLCAIKKFRLNQFWGDAVEIKSLAETDLMRQSHYLYGSIILYTYSAGLTIATQFSYDSKRRTVCC